MQNLNNISKAWFIGIGGIGMSAVARYFMHLGIEVAGYDRVKSDITASLQNDGVSITFEDSVDTLWKDADLVVYTPAIPKNHHQLNWYREQGFEVKKRSEVLEVITAEKYCIAVAGTHGKTTVSTMIAHLLRESGVDCTAFLGGVSTNFHSNFVAGSSDVVVVEADEFDRSFLRLHPNISVITAIDPDHLDVYGDFDSLLESFEEFANSTAADGKIIIKPGNPVSPKISPGKKITYDLHHPADLNPVNLKIEEGAFHFGLRIKQEAKGEFTLHYPGFHNVENALAALAVGIEMDISIPKAEKAMAGFKGIKRRFEYQIKTDRLVFIDDYAHHPVEIDALVKSVRAMYPNRRITAVFQPHLYSRTRDFADGFAASLNRADEVILLPIYPAREEPITGVSSQVILDKMTNNNKRLVPKSELVDTLKNMDLEVLLTIGAGDIDREVIPIREAIKTGNS